jgi:hypothetical protein
VAARNIDYWANGVGGTSIWSTTVQTQLVPLTTETTWTIFTRASDPDTPPAVPLPSGLLLMATALGVGLGLRKKRA